MDLTALEKALLPIASPLLLQLWESTLLPAIKAAAVSGSPEIQILESAGADFLDRIVKEELARLAKVGS
jgi:hypothetical protein